MKILLHAFALSVCGLTASANDWNTPHNGNPIIPGYFADPTIRKFGDTFYIYATTDGTGNGYGPAQVWMSKDLHNWRNVLLNWPTTEVVWAPDVVQQPDGSYRYYYCTPCQVYVGESDSPIGPWNNRLGAPDAVLVPDRFVTNAITLDPQLFRDDDGAEYLYFGTWGIYKGFGCGVARLSEDGKSFTDKKLIENTEITDFFEAPFVFKKDGMYYFTYSSGSCHDDTYRVQYAVSKDGPMGPYEYKGCILKTNADGTIHGPGHHSILELDGRYYIVYHRHNNPHSIHGFHRQICVDEVCFTPDGDILPIVPTHDGNVLPIVYSKQAKGRLTDLACGAKATASSTYSDWFRPEYVVDDNNGTLWRAADVAALKDAWLQIDLGKAQKINTVLTQFEFTTFFYQYLIETSVDGKAWSVFADKRDNTQQGSPMIDRSDKEVKARFVRLTVTATQKNGHFPAVWNIKVFRDSDNTIASLYPEVKVDEEAILRGYPWIHRKDVQTDVKDNAGLLLDIDASKYAVGSYVQGVPVVPKDGKTALRFMGQQTIVIDTIDMSSLTYNAPYTITAEILNPDPSAIETVARLMPAGNDLATIELRNGTNPAEGIVAHNASFENAGAADAVMAGKWQRWAVVFDGFMERVYCDGRLVSEKNIFLMLRPGGHVTIGADAAGGNPFTGFLHSLRLYNRPLTLDEINGKLHCTIQAEWLTPTSLRATVKDMEGKELKPGFHDFQIATSEAALETIGLTPVSSAILDMSAATGICARVTDVYGHSSGILSVPLPEKPDFNDLMPLMDVTLESASTNFTLDEKENGPTETIDIDGDFVIECEIAGMTGLASHQVPAYNEGGLILIGKEQDGTQSLVQLGVFPHYNCGNILTLMNRQAGRQQFFNSKGFNFDRRLQIERRHGMLHVRTANANGEWTAMPHSPFTCPEALRGSIKAGIYQTTYSDNQASVSFKYLHIWK